MAPVQRKNKKYDLKFKLSVVKYAEENSGEAAARRFSVDPKRVRDWRKNKTELLRRSEEDSERARLPGGGRKKASEELELNMREWVIRKRARHERVSRRMIRDMAKQMYATVSDSRDEEFVASAGWLNRFLRRNNFTSRKRTNITQKDARGFTEKLVKFVTFSSRVIESNQGGQTPPLSPGPGLKQEPPETPKIKEEPEDWSIKQEEEQLQVTIPDYITVRVKTEEVEEDEETLGEDISSEAHLHSEAEGDMEHLSDNEVDWTAPLSCSTVQMDTEIDGNNQVQFMARTATAQNFSLYGPVAETSAAIYNGDIPGAAERLPTGERSYSCSICNKDFTNISGLIYHKRTHTGEKPYSCPMCNTRYTSSSNLKSHMRSHSGEKPYSCSICNSWFTSSSNLKRHMGSHSGEKPFGCSSCDKTFARKSHLEVHMRTHTGEKPFSCSVCNARFALNAHLKSHMRCHKENK
ncbi:hypothetical protein NL108_009966 [Boleophthalmus pectinirostris]|uniref:zinc finger protein 287-like isoform X1 n=1 Tax=Boleophthalmus pectinirostris TaxID=150288 RepID=UPI002430E1A6|nr:zinc finger protein 287-like isoform X1 [Boleophthalmus pectinirostris]KAJ0055712.1 hypothetical protein NL108_009966 [Boleophthalmus pectinirostris]